MPSSSEKEYDPLFLDASAGDSPTPPEEGRPLPPEETAQDEPFQPFSGPWHRRSALNTELSRFQIFVSSLFPFLAGGLAAAGILYLYLRLKGNLP